MGRNERLRKLLRRRARLEARILKAQEELGEINDNLIKAVTRKEGREALFVDGKKIAAITQTSYDWDIERLRKLLSRPDVLRRARRTGMAFQASDLIESVIREVTTISVDRAKVEQLLKTGIIDGNKVQKTYTLKKNKPFIRIFDVEQ